MIRTLWFYYLSGNYSTGNTFMAKIKQPHIRMRLPLAEQEGFVRSDSDGVAIAAEYSANRVTLFHQPSCGAESKSLLK